MSKQTAALKLALEALEGHTSILGLEDREIDSKAITAIREALAEQPAQQQEPDEVKQIAEALRQVGLTLIRNGTGFRVADLGRVEAQTAPQPKAQQQEPVAWLHTKIEGVAVPHRPADLDKHPDRWEALYKTPPPCPTCEALARTVMLDQTYHDAQRKPLTNDRVWLEYMQLWPFRPNEEPTLAKDILRFARAIEAAHGITGETQ